MRIRPNIFAATIDLANLVDVEDVEVCQTGIEYQLASGPRTFTVSDLESARDSQDDPAVKAPRIKLGHLADLGIMSDGQPAIGTISDMKLEQGGHRLMGTYKGIPEWLAKILPSAYPARSIEGATAVTTVTDNRWELVITDLALLGVVWPGVTTLEDIQALYSKDGPDNVQVLTTREEVASLSVAAAAIVTAQVDADQVLRAWREAKQGDQMWWWVRSMMMDPNELIVEDEDEGQLYRIPYAIEGDGVTFSDPIAVKIVYQDQPEKEDKQAASLAAAAAIGALTSVHPDMKVVATYTSREESMSGIATDVDPVALRNALGLEEGATDDQVREALTAAGIVTPPGTATGDGAPASESSGTTATGGTGQPDNQSPSNNAAGDPETSAPNVQPSNANGSGTPAGTITPPTTASGSSEIVHLDRATYDELRAGAQDGRQARSVQLSTERDQVIDAAILAGKIAPSRRAHWVTKWSADEQEARTLLTASAEQGGLAPGLVPVDVIGGQSPLENTTIEAYPAEWLPELKREGATS